MMKRLFTIAACLFFANVCFAQDGFFQRIKNRFIEHDTVYIYVDALESDSIGLKVDLPSEEEDEDENSESIPMPIDTLDTGDKFIKVVLFDNGTWLYYNLEKPVIPDTLDTDHWVTDYVHSYTDIALKDLPEETDIVLVDSLHGFCIPYPGQVLSGFKFRHRRPHKGVDIPLHTGDAVYAAFDGVVRAALPTRMTGGYGNCLVIRHVNGLETYYGHLSKYIVKSGDVVKAGELIGYGGSTGRSTGPHLHFETRYMGQAFDPERIFDFDSGTLLDELFTLRKHYFSINSHYGMNEQQSLAASKKAPQSSGSSKGAVYYKVKKGDTLSKIASRNGTTVKKICQLNGIRENKVLQIGQRLRVK